MASIPGHKIVARTSFPFYAIRLVFDPVQVTISGGLGSAALVDMLVALTLSYYLNKGRSSWHKCVSRFGLASSQLLTMRRFYSQGVEQQDQHDFVVRGQHGCHHWVSLAESGR